MSEPRQVKDSSASARILAGATLMVGGAVWTAWVLKLATRAAMLGIGAAARDPQSMRWLVQLVAVFLLGSLASAAGFGAMTAGARIWPRGRFSAGLTRVFAVGLMMAGLIIILTCGLCSATLLGAPAKPSEMMQAAPVILGFAALPAGVGLFILLIGRHYFGKARRPDRSERLP